jgi:hypothetical protein
MTELFGSHENWKNLIEFESDKGLIKVISNPKLGNSRRQVKSFTIQFTTPNNTIVDIGTRRKHAFILKQLLENFDNFVSIKQFDSPTENYSNYDSLVQSIIPLKRLLKESEYQIEKEPTMYSYRYRLCLKENSKEETIELQNNLSEEQ